ncbi:hypothetical protein STEG23_031847, partial [Scotinomys teguina]
AFVACSSWQSLPETFGQSQQRGHREITTNITSGTQQMDYGKKVLYRKCPPHEVLVMMEKSERSSTLAKK